MKRLAFLAAILSLVLVGCTRPAPKPETKAEPPDPAMQTNAGYDETRDPAKDLAALVPRALAENKRILLEVGGEWCVWCHYLHNFLDKEKDIKELWDRNYLTLQVNYSDTNKNEVFLSKYPKIPGYPHIFVLEKDGTFLHSQGTDVLESGRGYSKEAVRAFLEKWRPL